MTDMQDLFGPGPSAGMPSFSDMLPTHPEQRRQKTMQEEYDFKVRVQQFDLNDDSERKEYEKILTEVIYGKKLLRQEKWSSDNSGRTTIALSWIDLIPKKKKKSSTAKGKSRKSGPTHGDNPGIKDGEYPGSGAVVEDGALSEGERKGEDAEAPSPPSSEEE